MIVTRDDIRTFGTILGIWAHPDDEAFSSSALMAAARQNGQRVVVLTATRGEAGITADQAKWPREDLFNIREKELQASLAAVGVEEHGWLNYKDGKLAEADADTVVAELANYIQQIKPDTVVTFDADGITGHDDHCAIHRYVVAALGHSGQTCQLLCAKENTEFYEHAGRQLNEKYHIYFNTDKPDVIVAESADVCFKPDAEIQEKKCRALEAHASQTASLFHGDDGQAALRLLCQTECFANCSAKIKM